MEQKLLFALDIGTRSVVGLVGEQTDSGIALVAVERLEHHTRAMLDGQIHDVPEVAQILAKVKTKLVSQVGPLQKVSVAAAGRALCTVSAAAELDCGGRGVLTAAEERALELAGIQTAQRQLATSKAVADPTSYYCVGYSVIHFTLDGTSFKSLIGQRGKTAGIELIATFLPRQVIDSLQSAIAAVDLEMATLTLEPIAAISVLIPPSMRHLNLALVDVGAGTSDVAITRAGSVIGYGMVPLAGDEITEAISQIYLLDFQVAETLKRRLSGKNKRVGFADVLGASHKLPTAEIVEKIAPAVGDLAQAIATQILALNAAPPQAVLLVGGGSLTPHLPEALAQALNIDATRVAIRRPEAIDGLLNIPVELQAPDGVTPLGILKLASGHTLNFLQVTLNGQPLRLFNLGRLTVADAMLVAGIEIRSLHGRPGMGITITINGQQQSMPGTPGQAGNIVVNNEEASFDSLLKEGDVITVTKGIDGLSPHPSVKEVVTVPPAVPMVVDNKPVKLGPIILVNGTPATVDTRLDDRDQILCRSPETLKDVLDLTGQSAEPRKFRYTVNGTARMISRWPEYALCGVKARMTAPIHADDTVTLLPVKLPTVAELLGATDESDAVCEVLFNGTACRISTRRYAVRVDGKAAELTQALPAGSLVESTAQTIQPLVSDVLLAAEFSPGTATGRVVLLLNGQPAEYTAVVKNGDKIDLTIN